eukprot:7378955-Prymnesium_polylepis.2
MDAHAAPIRRPCDAHATPMRRPCDTHVTPCGSSSCCRTTRSTSPSTSTRSSRCHAPPSSSTSATPRASRAPSTPSTIEAPPRRAPPRGGRCANSSMRSSSGGWASPSASSTRARAGSTRSPRSRSAYTWRSSRSLANFLCSAHRGRRSHHMRSTAHRARWPCGSDISALHGRIQRVLGCLAGPRRPARDREP